ncbi:MAG: sugar ABC transporter permease [Clostridia bacterium]|nr:sugar ABC transporter permease [Clostridia bacterium]
MKFEVKDDVLTKSFSLDSILNWFKNPTEFKMLIDTAKNSLMYYGITLCISIPLGLLFAYYIFKKMPLSKMFRILLFVPSIIPAAAFVLTFKSVFEVGATELFDTNAFLFNRHQFAYIIFYNLYISFGTSVLMYANKMFDISPEIIEAGKLDGATGIKEFWHIVLPLTFSTLSVFLVTGVATIFTNHYNLVLFNPYPDTWSLGHLLYVRTGHTRIGVQALPPVAALGFILTLIAIPLTFGVKRLLEKFGPSEE